MTVHQSRQTRSRQVIRDDQGRVTFLQEEQKTGPRLGSYVVALLALLAVGVLCITAFVLVRVLLQDKRPALLPAFSTWTPTATSSVAPAASTASPMPQPSTAIVSDPDLILINPVHGNVNTLVTVTGEGWWAGEPVFVFLRSPAEGDGRGYSYAAAVADDWGNFRMAFTFPNESRWVGEGWADVIARGTRSGQEASTRFTLLRPTFTPTPLLPTARPTQAPTETPAPTLTPLPTDTPLPTPTPEPPIMDWRGEYFAGMVPGSEPILTRNDVVIDFNWGLGSPGWGIPDDGFSVWWTRRQHFDEGSYRFTVMADDGVRVRLDGQILLDEWHDSTQEVYVFDVYLSAGDHSLHVEYYENLGGARIYVGWDQLGGQVTTPIPVPTEEPQPVLPPIPTLAPIPTLTPLPPMYEGWQAEYFDNVSLDGLPVLTRVDRDLHFEWGADSPGTGVPSDDFSARWTQVVDLTSGTYRYSLEADDGARLWLDGNLLINAWPAAGGQIYSVEIYVPEGRHVLKVEYFEVTIDARIHFWDEAVP